MSPAKKKKKHVGRSLWWVQPKRPRVAPPPPGLPPALAKELAALGTGFENTPFRDYAFWLSDAQLYDPALQAVVEADSAGNSQPVDNFLRSGPKLSPWGKKVIDDYRERTRESRRGRKAVPIYAVSMADALLMIADEEVTNLIRVHFKSEAEAVAEVARSRNIPIEKLQNFHDGRRGSTRRMGKRRRK